MPRKGIDGVDFGAQNPTSAQSVQDFDITRAPNSGEELYGVVALDSADAWAAPSIPVPIETEEAVTATPGLTASAQVGRSVRTKKSQPLSAQTLGAYLYALLDQFGGTILDALEKLGRRLLFIPRFVGAAFSWAFRELRKVVDKQRAQQKKQAKHERGMLRRELKGIRPYLKKANGNTADWFRRVGVVGRKLAENHRASVGRVLNVVLPVVAAVVLFAYMQSFNDQTYALRVDYQDSTLGYISSEAVFTQAQALAEKRIVRADTAASASALSVRPTFKIERVNITDLQDAKTLSNAIISDSGTNLTTAVGIYIDNDFLCSVKNRSDAESVFDAILAPYRTGEAGTFVDFVEDIRYQEGYYPDESKTMWDASALAKKLATQKATAKYYTIQDKDTKWDIARKNGLTIAQLEALNPKYKSDKEILYPGAKMVISGKVNYIQVKQMKTETRSVDVPFETVYTNNANLFKGQTKTISNGQVGKEKVTEIVTYLDGARVGVQEVERERVAEPVSAKVEKGIKSAYISSSGGSSGSSSSGGGYSVTVSRSGFVWPAPSCHLVSSPYGYRWGRIHTGVDLVRAGGHSSGLPVVASLDGTVEMASWYAAYGNCIVINHGGGYKTRYAHLLSGSMSVRVGQHVTAGQAIGRVGSTGRSSGPHLHFEVIVNGSTRNPLPYIR
ncbi:MAG: peptidoglycan DD-metalloendopeptidase family protein [Oscillospiraceae bacterium]|nr:peptidoglycan DD-metalloendopeptidase family protein [Oscillospiraceae bacterium]